MGSFAFASPFLLIALVALPAIWWLLRVTPPKPVREVFPPLKILRLVTHREETPATSPWWLTALRMLLAALVIFALSGPVMNPAQKGLVSSAPLALVIDNDWASAPDWDARVKTAKSLIAEAASADIPVSLTLTAEPLQDQVPTLASTALDRLNAAIPRPLEADRKTAFERLQSAFGDTHAGTLAYISSGVAAPNDNGMSAAIVALKPQALRVYSGNEGQLAAISGASNGSRDMDVTATRLDARGAQTLDVDARDTKGRVLMKGKVSFADGKTVATGKISAPIELRNDFARITIEGAEQAGGTYLLDDGFKRRRVGIISGESRFLSQPLLSPLYYIRRALSPFTDIVEPTETDLAKAIPDILSQKPSMIVLADIGRLPDASYPLILDWIRKGGTLVRFAGPRLAAAPAEDPLVPVELRQGERALGGALSWSEPQPLAPFPANSPFAGLSKPEGVLVQRQVLANPSPTLAEHTWASLADGTPLVTGKKLDAGDIVLFHTSADASWSNLALSGHFVEMLRRIAQLSRARAGSLTENTAETLAPFRLLDAHGALTNETGAAKPLTLKKGSMPVPSFNNPPGLYGTEEGFTALNLLQADDELKPLDLSGSSIAVEKAGLAGAGTTDLQPWLLMAAFLLLVADSIAVLIMGGALTGLTRRRKTVAAGLVVTLAAGFAFATVAFTPLAARADDSRPGDDQIIAALDTTHLGYVLTGEDNVDTISKEGLTGLSDFMRYRTSLEPGAPKGLDIERDELSFYPLIYWPVTATAPMPSKSAISRIDAYMRAGGTVLFDTRDQISNLDGSAASPNTQRLQAILADLDIPPLEPVPHTHVLTKSFYLLQNFPGRYNGSPLWIEASNHQERDTGRPVERGDGVSPIMITGNDFAGAWATDSAGNPLFPTVPSDERQRELAFRSGVNIVMYMLTGNYKSDQVHIPALLERLGQ
jgi:hypothetical protein